MESVWNACLKVRFIVLFRIFSQGIFRTFSLTFGFPRKIFFLEFQAVPSFLKNIFSNLRTFSGFSVFSACSFLYMEYFTAFLKKQKLRSKNPTRSLRVGSSFILFLVQLAAKRSVREQFAHLDCTCEPVGTCEHDFTAGQKHNVSIDTHGLAR